MTSPELAARKLPREWYLRSDVVAQARELLGSLLVHRTADGIIAGRIVETEAYAGVSDRACHAFGGRRTARTETMYRIGGTAYVYLCYGIHQLFNVITGPEGVPNAILVRALEPVAGITLMRRRRGDMPVHRLCRGPGCLTRALGITGDCDGLDLCGETLWIAADREFAYEEVRVATRIGVAYAGADADLPYRFAVRGSPCVSR